MAKRKGKTQKRSNKERKISPSLLKLAIAMAIILLLAMSIQGNIVRVQCVELPIKSLPVAFDGVKIAFVSDLHITSLNSRYKVNHIMNVIMEAGPDILLLGGDYTGSDILLRLCTAKNNEEYATQMTEMRDLFFVSLRELDCPLGKYAVAGDMDNMLERESGTRLEEAAQLGGITLLRDESVRLQKDDESLVLVGVDDWRTGIKDTLTPSQGVTPEECVLLISHTPEAVSQLSGQSTVANWVDVALTGHTLGGQFTIGDRELLNPLGEQQRYQSGWRLENRTKLLVSQGLSPEALPMRWGTTGQIHIITLKAD